VLRFNALPVLEASAEVTRVTVPAGWRRREVRRAMTPRAAWPVVVNGPGEMLCLGSSDVAVLLLAEAAKLKSLSQPGPATTSRIDLLAENAPPHHQLVLLQLIAHALQQALPLRMQTGKHGDPELIATEPDTDEATAVSIARTQLSQAYEEPLFGYLPAQYGKTAHKQNRRWAEEVRLSFDRRAGRHWLLFTPSTWIEPLPRPLDPDTPRATDIDPADKWRAERWATRRFNEKWAAIIRAWTTLLAPEEPTLLSPKPMSSSRQPSGRVLLGRTNAYSRPAW
jgi:hypothetical protein